MGMRSIQVRMCDPQNAHLYSDLLVLKSAAGFYVGTIFNNTFGPEPGSRDTDYFESEEDANFALQILERLDKSDGYKSSLWVDKKEFITCTFSGILHSLEMNPRDVGYRMHP